MADVHYNKRLALLNYFHTTMFPDRFHHALSAFNHSTHRWAHLLSYLLSHYVSSTSRNFPSHLGMSTPSTRGPSHAANSSSITFSKDPSLPTSSFSKKSLPTSDARVRSDFWVTDAEGDASFSNVSFATMALLSNKRFASDPDPQLGGEGVEERGKLTLESVFRMKVREGCALRGPCQPS